MIHSQRIEALNNNDPPRTVGRYVLYWMQASQRSRWNHALEYAIDQANARKLPVVVVFGITDNYPEANERHYVFMLEGLKQTRAALRRRGIQMIVRHQSPELAALQLSKDASIVVTDRGYLRIQRQWRLALANEALCPVVQVESDAVVPVDVASDKEEFAARTLRPRIHRAWKEYLVPLRERTVAKDSIGMKFESFNIDDTDAALAKLRIDRSVGSAPGFRGGEEEAERLLKIFLKEKLADYPKLRNDPSLNAISHMSSYLHFGQVSPLEIALRVESADAPRLAKDAYIEELIVRRELSMNFVLHNSKYDDYDCLPQWARNTLRVHEKDLRPVLYTARELEEARTGDRYWNAAQREMVITGKMHNYMRMYWGKKILEWCRTPRHAFDVALKLNNRYELDGRDPNSFAGVAWCFGKHDRPWQERPIFGMVRYMNAAGLERKFDADAYVQKIDSLK